MSSPGISRRVLIRPTFELHPLRRDGPPPEIARPSLLRTWPETLLDSLAAQPNDFYGSSWSSAIALLRVGRRA
jgi:hypothetical protein